MCASIHNLESKQEQESHHEAEETHSLRQSESQNGKREKLSFQRWVTGVSDDKASEDASDTSS